jgi:hypothetical protein
MLEINSRNRNWKRHFEPLHSRTLFTLTATMSETSACVQARLVVCILACSFLSIVIKEEQFPQSKNEPRISRIAPTVGTEAGQLGSV